MGILTIPRARTSQRSAAEITPPCCYETKRDDSTFARAGNDGPSGTIRAFPGHRHAETKQRKLRERRNRRPGQEASKTHPLTEVEPPTSASHNRTDYIYTHFAHQRRRIRNASSRRSAAENSVQEDGQLVRNSDPKEPVTPTAVRNSDPNKPVALTEVRNSDPKEPVASTEVCNSDTRKPVAPTEVCNIDPKKPVAPTKVRRRDPEAAHLDKPYRLKKLSSR
ncbi:hypothetical protein FQA39_LY05376 [Lamprigera yunnana]|nr:hypothetical protein FQA39_LY05376 [Lamprigera yunnana]